MPIIKSAIKKLRVDKKRAAINLPVRARVKSTMKAARTLGDKVSVAAAFSALDKAVNHNLMTKNGVARLKSRLTKMIKVKGKINPFSK
ncbi:MAG: 30S ribosomal protein S20 [bacterium]